MAGCACTMMAAVAVAAAVLLQAAPGSGSPAHSEETLELLRKIERGRWLGPADGVPADFECTWRKAAMAYATELLPELTKAQQSDVFDSLQLGTLCGLAFVPAAPSATAATPDTAPDCSAAGTHCVDSVEGLLQALDDIAAAAPPSPHGPQRRVALTPGTYRLNATLVLGPEHSNTRIDAPQGGVTISGAQSLSVAWAPVTTKRGVRAFAAAVPAGLRIDALRVDGQRATRARFPNANPERDQFPAGWITKGTKSIQPAPSPPAEVINVELPGAYPGTGDHDRYGKYGFAGIYRVGVGGPCAKLTPPESYWCQPDGRTAGEQFMVRTPAGIANATAQLPHSPYADGGAGATVFYWRPGHWFSVMYGLAGPINATSGDLVFGHGGFQGAEGHSTVGEWYIENVAEELDAPNEFYHDTANNRLLLVYNGTGTPPATVEVPSLAELILLNGTQAAPVDNVTIEGLVVTGQRPTYLEPHGLPSGGDWGLERLGAVRLAGTRGVRIEGNLFRRLDGNAVFLDGYNREAVITGNEFVSLGASGIALWGYEDAGRRGYGLEGNQPRFTTVTGNVCHELGIYQKQSSCFFQAVSAQSTVQRNLFYNGPRAMVNFNDGFGGGHDLGHNILYNSCRESSDHGAFNSWDRQPYVTTVGDGSVSAQPAYSRLHHNWIVSNYAADGGAYDNDDGSSWYLEEDNFCIYGGMKSNFEGHNKRSTGNLHAFASVYGDRCLNGLNQINDKYAEAYSNNTCILTKAGDQYLEIGGCPAEGKGLFLQLGNNTVYAPNASVVVSCGKAIPGPDWLALGQDKGTTIRDSSTLTSADIVQIGLRVLAQQP